MESSESVTIKTKPLIKTEEHEIDECATSQMEAFGTAEDDMTLVGPVPESNQPEGTAHDSYNATQRGQIQEQNITKMHMGSPSPMGYRLPKRPYTRRSMTRHTPFNACQNDINQWIRKNLDYQKKSKLLAEEVRTRCAIDIDTSFSSKQFGFCLRSIFPQVRLNNQGRSSPSQPIVMYYYGLSYKSTSSTDVEIAPVWGACDDNGEYFAMDSYHHVIAEDEVGVNDQEGVTHTQGYHSSTASSLSVFSPPLSQAAMGVTQQFSTARTPSASVTEHTSNVTAGSSAPAKCGHCREKNREITALLSRVSSLVTEKEALMASLRRKAEEKARLVSDGMQKDRELTQLRDQYQDTKNKIDIIKRVISM